MLRAWTFFSSTLDLLPVAEDGVGVGGDGVGEDVRMAADELGAEVFGDVAEVEAVGCGQLGGHLGVEEDLQQEVAELVLEVGPGAALDGVEDLVGLFEGVALDGVEGLFAVPGAAAGRAQAGHDGGGALQGCGGGRLGLFAFDRVGGVHCIKLTRAGCWGAVRARAENGADALNWKMQMDLSEKIRTLPTGAGCYLYKNAEGEVIYVGKAKNLRARVRSYFLAASQANAKTGSLMREAVDLEYILVANEREALALENNLIKQRKPRFNILLRDDKTYPYIKLTLADKHPKVFVTRRLRKDGSAYFGPYFPGNLAYRLVDVIHRSFLIPSCKVDLNRYHPRACLQYYIKRCLGPCVEGFVSTEDYAQAIRDVQLFLEGKPSELEARLTERMERAAENMQFELAAKLRDQLITISQAQDRQRIASTDDEDADVFGFHYENDMLAVNLFHMRGGKDRRPARDVLGGAAGAGGVRWTAACG